MAFKNRRSSASNIQGLERNETFFINIHANRAADLIDREQLQFTNKERKVNPVLLASLNGTSRKTHKKLSTINPSWDQTLSLPLKSYDKSLILHLSVWDKHRAYKLYLGELRIDITQLFKTEDEGGFTPVSQLKWYKLYSNNEQHSFVTGSLLLSFELAVKRGKGLIKRKKTVQDLAENGPSIKIKVEPPSRKNTTDVKMETLKEFQQLNLSASSLTPVSVPDNKKEMLFNNWRDSLIYIADDVRALMINDQGFYSDTGDISDVLVSDADLESVSEKSSIKSDELNLLLLSAATKRAKEPYLSDQSSLSGASIVSSDYMTTDFEDESDSSVLQSSEVEGSTQEDNLTNFQKKKALKFKLKRRSKKTASSFEIRNRHVDGVLFIEVVSCSDLPPIRRFAGMGRYDMDPFVVVTFGKQTFRTSWKRHNLNPVFNERLAFQILKSEKNYDVHFLVLDKDRFSLHDNVAEISIPLKDLTKMATASSKISLSQPANGVANYSYESLTEEFTDSDAPENANIKVVDDQNIVETMEKRLIRKRLKLKYSDTSKFRTIELNLKLANEKYQDDYSPKLKLRVRYEPYENLRRSFWKRLLKQYSLSDENKAPVYDYIELISLLDTLGCENSDEVVNKFFENYDKLPWGGDTLTIEQITDSLEEHISSNNDKVRLFEFEQCPNCLKKRLTNKHDIDIVTHFAICGSKDWSIVNKLLVSSYVTPQLASKRWFTKLLIKLSYGKYQLGSNSANILVQDRTTGIVLEEKMGIYVRLGIRLLYKGFDQARKRKIRSLLKKLSVKQGVKFDDASLKNDIPSFVKFHKLDLSECLEQDITKYETFNDFFYRKLKEGARPIEAESDDNIIVSPADCRCVVYETVNEATELWIKGRNFTIAKLFNGNFDNLEKTDLYNPDRCAVGVFRLAPQDYHRFHSPVSGKIREIKYIEGEYYTVNPMAIRSELDVFGENVRVLISIETQEFGVVVMIPVGAMMVGSTVLTKGKGDVVKKGDEMGYFKFGGSTVILLFDKSKMRFDSDLVTNSGSSIETLIRVGQSIGHSPLRKEFARDHIDFEKLPKSSKKNLIRVITGGDLTDSKEIRSWEVANMRFSEDDVESAFEELSEEENED